MEVPVINRLSNFDGGHVTTCLQNHPSLISQILSIKAFQAQSFWKWSAFIIAMIASFGTLINRIRLLIIRLQCHYCKTSSSDRSLEPLLSGYDDFSDYSDDEIEENDVLSWSSSDYEDDDVATTSFHDGNDDVDFHVRGSGYYGDERQGQEINLGLRRRRFSWSDFSSGKSVVKLWDSFGLAYEDEDEFETVATSSPATILSAATSDSGRVKLGVWDARVGTRIPAILAEWGPAQFGRIVGARTGKVYVRDDVTGDVAIGDLRRFESPCGVDKLSSDSAVTRCCDAVWSYLL